MISNPVLILPGYGGSGPLHWQTLWEKAYPGFTRVEEKDWEAPHCGEWVETLEAAVRRSGPDTVLVAHSLACLQVAHWVAHRAFRSMSASPVRAAFLVAPPDPDGPVFPAAARGFSPVPLGPLPFPALVVGSTNDPYAEAAFTEACARAWGARFVSAGPLGHINADSGLGEWREGMGLLLSLLR
ncbi:MAG: hypothetical protein K0Q91_1630 [Fibrobacteria bacterium]|jgi:predicted alpha/beta hydrolase family esterase|nr:hypothetical protein [Fibrobacteria bacterium]